MTKPAVRSVTSHCSECGNQVHGYEVCPDHPDATIESISTLLASDGTMLGVGVRVVDLSDDGDAGTVLEVDGDNALVNWDSCDNDSFLVHASELRAESAEPYEASLPGALKWAASAAAGEYLVHYEDTGLTDDEDPGSRCGYDDQELDAIRKALRARGLRLEADDRGLLAASKP